MEEFWTYLSYKPSYNQFYNQNPVLDARMLDRSLIQADFDPNFVAMASRVGRGKI